ncbi:LysM peptidoglycan-binding domain-containing protein [Cellulomonas phragmiteti]|uniref:LysM domain-containing protein n=1 Tax=Cellulomonas phragmiteti TaxID=478780 RepID=A0ABQ4DK15_9CELL|nr:LysM peptidoglycan-binding domain-containing protein [Cellulomonas phragmiteti]GIG39665.1 hypothetical protein Cph01nite_14270 [Cellulomonas phragmiteti]
MTDQPQSRLPRPPRPAAAALGLVLVGAVALLVAAGLGLWVADQVGATRLWRVESVVAPLVVAVGALAAAWVGVSASVAGACAAVRAAGGAWRLGEVAVQRWAPGLVRRALVVALAAGVGLGGAVGATASTPAPPPATVAAADLGWTPTSTTLGTPSIDTPTTVDAAAVPDSPADPARAETGVADDADARLDSPAPADAPAAGATTHDGGATGAVPVAAPLPAVGGTTPGAPPSAPVSAPTGTVTVRPGDTLWGLAARALGPDASDAAIAAEWPRWYAANAATIGADPDVLQPGQVLTVPTTTDGGAR